MSTPVPETPTPTNVVAEHDAPAPATSAPPADAPATAAGDPPADDPAETFPREYVEKLRGESHRYRTRAQSAESRTSELAAALWTTRVAATDRLADPADLPLPDDIDPLDSDALDAAVAELLERKPHLAARRARGDVGASETPAGDDVSLAALLRSGT